ncbi:hypothetical protein J6590_038831 [Homalodisca vitripennis]|nr:hypothetical protein J6590_038831 [Homalodisca vitripennis]
MFYLSDVYREGTMEDWQLKLDRVNERGKHLLETGIWSDCQFLVGDGQHKKKFSTHKMILSMSSPVFEAMFYGGLAEENDPIEIPDVQPEAFTAMLEYIYTDEINLTTIEQACELCYAAKKYMLPFLVNQCMSYIWKDVKYPMACRAYEFAKLFDEAHLMIRCMETDFSSTSPDVAPKIHKETSTDEKQCISLSVLENKWVTDDTILLYYNTLTLSFLPSDSNVLLMNAVVTHAIKCLQDYDHLLEPLKLNEKSHIFFPIHDLHHEVNTNDHEDKQNVYKTEGSHWSPMVFVRSVNKFLYFDSSQTYNLPHAKQISKKVNKFLGAENETSIQIVGVPQQTNTFDCGIYLTLFTDIVLQLLILGSLNTLGEPGSRLPCMIKQADILTKRAQQAYMWHKNQHLLLTSVVESSKLFKVSLYHNDSTPL